MDKVKKGRLLCRMCKKQKELVCCNDCYLEMQGWALQKVMEGDPNQRIVDELRLLRWDLEDFKIEIMEEINK